MSSQTAADSVDLTNCDREPIQIPGAIQPHGFLLVLQEPGLEIIQISANTPQYLGSTADEILGSPLRNFFWQEDYVTLVSKILPLTFNGQSHYLHQFRSHDGKQSWSVSAHRWDSVLILELQPKLSTSLVVGGLQATVRKTIADLDTCESLSAFCQSAVEYFREITRFDRVMIYRFLEDGAGVVVAESMADELDPYLGLHYPASDIPQQARRLYVLNPYRLTADVNAEPVPLIPSLNPKTKAPLDMSFCALRATSPVHLQYLRNMGVAASLSFSIVRDGKLWGLVACHHQSANVLPQEVRLAGEILARLLGLQVGLKEEAAHKQYVQQLRDSRLAMGQRLRESGDFFSAMTVGQPNLLTGISASGAALFTASETFLLGRTPTRPQVQQLCQWVGQCEWQPVWATHSLTEHYESAKEFAQCGSGILVLRVAAGSPETVVWFRPEVVETINWAGNPNKPVETSHNGTQALHPRTSFALWQEKVRGQSRPWQQVEVEHATELREYMSQALLQHRAAEIARLNAQLVRSNEELSQFAAVASHDLQEPLRTVRAYTQLLLRRPEFQDNADVQEMAGFVVDATGRMSTLIASLLEFARTGRQPISPIDASLSLRLAISNLHSLIEQNGALINYGEMPQVMGTENQLSRVFQNLISNALKYRRPEEAPKVEITTVKKDHLWQFAVKDNGMGFDPAYAEKIFESFQRLHGREYLGTGLGLAICRKIIEGFGGRIWAESQPGAGSTFFFVLQEA